MKHVRESPGRPGRHRAEVASRHGRLTVLGACLAVTLIAVASGFGFASSDPSEPAPSTSQGAPVRGGGAEEPDRGTLRAEPTEDAEAVADRPARATTVGETAESAESASAEADSARRALPAGSGTGRRVVFSESAQRVWLVARGDEVVRTYLASGSVYDNLDPGTYQVFSRSRHAVGVDDSGTMEYFVRFTYGDAGAAIGFHTIPVQDGRPVQTHRQLGTPLSHGCIRQRRADAIALWEFAPLGTTVVVTA